MTPTLRIVFICKDPEVSSRAELRLESRGHKVVSINRLSAVLGTIYSDPPDLIIIDLSEPR